jgi:hypothetical protein
MLVGVGMPRFCLIAALQAGAAVLRCLSAEPRPSRGTCGRSQTLSSAAHTSRRCFPWSRSPQPLDQPLHQHPLITMVHALTVPSPGPRREMKKALEEYWSGAIDGATLLATAAAVDDGAWRAQAAAGIDLIGLDSTLYDQVCVRCFERPAQWAAAPGCLALPAGHFLPPSFGLSTASAMHSRAPLWALNPALTVSPRHGFWRRSWMPPFSWASSRSASRWGPHSPALHYCDYLHPAACHPPRGRLALASQPLPGFGLPCQKKNMLSSLGPGHPAASPVLDHPASAPLPPLSAGPGAPLRRRRAARCGRRPGRRARRPPAPVLCAGARRRGRARLRHEQVL